MCYLETSPLLESFLSNGKNSNQDSMKLEELHLCSSSSPRKPINHDFYAVIKHNDT